MRPSSVYDGKLTSQQAAKVALVSAKLNTSRAYFRSPVHELQDKATFVLDADPAALEQPIVKWPKALRISFMVSSSVLLWGAIGYLMLRFL
jgi:hypothetical protein